MGHLNLVAFRKTGLMASAALLVAFMVAAMGCDDGGPAMVDESDLEIANHIAALKAGDFTREGLPLSATERFGEPYHLWRLTDIGPRSANQLLPMLSDDTPTPFTYYEKLTFRGGLHVGQPEKRVATLGDLADYALRWIYYPEDGGYRSYLSTEERQEAIQRWRQIVRDHVAESQD